VKKCCMCGKEYGWQEWGKHIYPKSNICYACDLVEEERERARRQVANGTAQGIKGVPKNKVLSIVDACFHAHASSYRTEAIEMAKNLLAEI